METSKKPLELKAASPDAEEAFADPRTGSPDGVAEELAPHLRFEDTPARVADEVGQHLGQHPADRVEWQAAAATQQSDQPQHLDVAFVVDEAVRCEPVRWGKEALGEVVADRRGADAGQLDEGRHRQPTPGQGPTHRGRQLAPGNVVLMQRVLVVTDSSACIPVELVSSLGIRVLPISIFLPEGELELSGQLDEETLVLPEGAEDEELAAANRPFVTEYLAAIEDSDVDAAVVITPAVEFATMYRNAALAAELAERAVVTIDARSAAAGQALVVLAGAEVAAAGGSLEEVVAAAEDAVRRVELVASLATLEPIRRSGPLPSSVLGDPSPAVTRTLFRMRAGSVEPLGVPSGTEEALRAIAAACHEGSPGGTEHAVVFHAGATELAGELAELLGDVDFVCGFSVAMQVHTGRGVVGAAWLPKAPAPAR